jgi:hypothetical protein
MAEGSAENYKNTPARVFFYLVGWDFAGPFAGPLGSYKPQYCGHIFGLLYIFPG